jgi:hypothetical protein
LAVKLRLETDGRLEDEGHSVRYPVADGLKAVTSRATALAPTGTTPEVDSHGNEEATSTLAIEPGPSGPVG